MDRLQGALYKRKDYIGVEEEAKLHPMRTYYYRKNVDVDNIIEQCTRKVTAIAAAAAAATAVLVFAVC